MKILTIIFIMLLLPAAPLLAADSTMTKAAAAMGREMDRQLADRFGQQEGTINGISVIITTPVDLNDFEASNPVARQMQEELSRWFIQAGYSVQEVRQGKALLMRPYTGELLLTRNKELMHDRQARSALTLAATYSLTSRNMIFNVRLMQTGGTEVYAMSNITLPISGELRGMISTNLASAANDGSSGGGMRGHSYNDFLIEPSVFNRLP